MHHAGILFVGSTHAAEFIQRFGKQVFSRRQRITQARGPADALRNSRTKNLFLEPKFDAFPRPRDSGVEQLPGQHRALPVRQNEQDAVELRSLAFVNRHRVGGFMLGQANRQELAQAIIRPRKEGPRLSITTEQ